MKRNPRAVGSTDPLSAYRSTEVLFASLAVSLAVVAVVLAAAFPVPAALAVVTGATARAGVGVARRVSTRDAATRATVDVPFTDRSVEV